MSAYKTAFAVGKDSADALVASAKASAAGAQEFANTTVEMTKANLERTVAAVKAVAGAKSLDAAFEAHSAYVRDALDHAVADGKALIGLTNRVAGEVTRPLTECANTALAWPSKTA